MDYAIEMLNITKDFPGIRANDNVTLKVERGTIHALLGENGAGKSTLMSILFGLYEPTEGIIKVNGKEVKITNPNVANDLGIGMVHQHFKLVHNFTVTENIILGSEPKTKFGTVDTKTTAKRIDELSKKYGFDIDPSQKIEDITVGMQQRVEILKMLYRNADILIFDEPTAVLTPQEIDELIAIMKSLAAEGKTIILITHKLKEIKAVADKCTVLRRGKFIAEVEVSKTSEKEMAELMVGREVDFKIHKPEIQLGNKVLEIKDLCVKNTRGTRAVENFSLSVRSGEIVGIAGIDGNGQKELVEAITGLCPITSGTLILNGKDVSGFSIKKRIDSGIGHVPEDRHKHGLILDFKLKENFIIHGYNTEQFSKNGILNFTKIDQYADKLINEFDVRSGQGKETITRSMSGGNQQKAIIAREIDRSPDLLIVVQPTRGLDVGAIEYIHSRIVNERNAGKAVLLVSFELDEILGLSDRIAVMYNGGITGIVNDKETDEKQLGLMMAGSKIEGVSDHE
ncbi:ABC transporter ATP-binding protein [Anaerorhabdus furcosa]|uniref:Simple sugar transport system ATP-binding protein n=1 Tax=Anaerorhabdus furcosa TaxID=118967 RepID=A0A1T4NGJ3_9FIRM|nr:ABC transporter ATP-binding protein [Anaerorhabdus furcosa]SJZ78379.1 simple sugar transport system ATP-binding protein [Anaerorhabdus furcosa]